MASVEASRRGAVRLGSYDILHMFARGGMAELYLARSIGLEGFEKLVVLKRILPSFAQNAKFVRLFLDEAKLAASLDHPNIAHVYDLGMVDGNYFFTMEYVHGQDMRHILHRSTRHAHLPIEHVVQISRNVAAALHYAHERTGPGGNLGIVHRDVSPSNIVVSYEGTVKLLDFGVAKAATSTVKTRTGTLKGKVAYMSPEQARGMTIDRRSDIFSAGIVMWEMVATKRLFKAENDLATLQLVINTTPPPLSQLRSDCPPELDRIIQKALAQDRDARYQTAQELQSDLDELARESRLAQSSIAIGNHMAKLFAPEVEAWKTAQTAGTSFTDYVIAASQTGSGASIGPDDPFAESDNDDEDDEDLSQSLLSQAIVEDEQTARSPVPSPPIAPASTATSAAPVSTAPASTAPNSASVAPVSTPASTARASTAPTSTAPESTARASTAPGSNTASSTPADASTAVAPITPAAAPKPKPKRKRAKEPEGWATSPSIVIEPALEEEASDLEVTDVVDIPTPPPVEPANEPIAAAPPPSLEAWRKTEIVTVPALPDLEPRRSRRAIWIGVGLVAVAGVVILVMSMQGGSKTNTDPTRSIANTAAPSAPAIEASATPAVDTPPADDTASQETPDTAKPAAPQKPADTALPTTVVDPGPKPADEAKPKPKAVKPKPFATRPTKPTRPVKPPTVTRPVTKPTPPKPKFDPDAPLPPM